MKKRRSLSVASELEELARALKAARLLADYIVCEQLASAEDSEHAPALVAAILNVTNARLQLLARVVRGNADPALLVAPHNECIIGESGVLLEAWAPARKSRSSPPE